MLNWIKLGNIVQESIQYSKKPVIDLKISGEDIDPKMLSRQLLQLETSFLYYDWSIFDEDSLLDFLMINLEILTWIKRFLHWF